MDSWLGLRIARGDLVLEPVYAFMPPVSHIVISTLEKKPLAPEAQGLRISPSTSSSRHQPHTINKTGRAGGWSKLLQRALPPGPLIVSLLRLEMPARTKREVGNGHAFLIYGQGVTQLLQSTTRRRA